MSLLRLLLLGLIFYLAYKAISVFMRGLEHKERTRVQGKPRSKPPLNLDNHDVEDADFEDIK